MARAARKVSGEPHALAAEIKARLRRAGPITIADYMASAAVAYYANREPFGTAGDFITAPEISQTFGEMIAAWCVELWRRLGAPDPVLVVELGPGRGTLMADFLRATRPAPEFGRALRLHLVERSERLRRIQASALAAAAPRFHDDVATLPPGPMLLVANEFLDALPIRQFERYDGAWRERRVGLSADGGDLAFCRDPQPSPLGAGLPPATDGAIAEICPAAAVLAQQIGARIASDGGAALFVDYGYFPRACGDTLQAVKAHRPHAVLEAPGQADLTAHVDFAAFAAAARRAGAAVYGPATQRAFLLRLGIAERAAKLAERASAAQGESVLAGCARLIDPEGMGSLFKVMALGQAGAPAPAGFGIAS